MVLCIVMSLFITNTFAQQLEEVRGVQTRVVTYEDNDGVKMKGFEFKNENSYAVWVDADLVTKGSKRFEDSKTTSQSNTCDKKSFSLKPGEAYIWKCGRKIKYYGGECYVEYKAYKAK